MTITETDGRTYGCCLIKQLQYQEKLLYLTTLGTGEVLQDVAHGPSLHIVQQHALYLLRVVGREAGGVGTDPDWDSRNLI